MVEDMEECALSRGFAYQILNIIQNQGVNALIEVYEIIDAIVF